MFDSTPARMARAARLSQLIESGDVDAARRYFATDCGSKPWGGIDAARVRCACAKWGIDPTALGCSPPRECPSDLWHLRASFQCAPVPMHPTGGDFQLASMQAASNVAEPAYVWRLEAIRWRMGHPGADLDLPAIEAKAIEMRAFFARRAA